MCFRNGKLPKDGDPWTPNNLLKIQSKKKKKKKKKKTPVEPQWAKTFQILVLLNLASLQIVSPVGLETYISSEFIYFVYIFLRVIKPFIILFTKFKILIKVKLQNECTPISITARIAFLQVHPIRFVKMNGIKSASKLILRVDCYLHPRNKSR